MRFQHFMIIFVIIALSYLIPNIIRSDVMAASSHTNDEYSQYLITATESSMASVYNNQSYVFDSELKRQTAVKTFYETLSKSFNYDFTTYKELLQYYVPCIFLIDVDGYYVEYTDVYTDTNGNLLYGQLITPINKWVKTYSVGGTAAGNYYSVEYHLDNSIIVTYNLNGIQKTLSGDYREVYEKLGSPSGLSSLRTDEGFEAEKNDVIINILQEQIEYYVNTFDGFLNQRMDTQYQFTLTKIKGENWSRLIDEPTVISFLQGYNSNYFNIYAFAGAEIEKDTQYYIEYDASDSLYYYHRNYCSKLTNNSIYYSMREAAEYGAYPCPECIR